MSEPVVKVEGLNQLVRQLGRLEPSVKQELKDTNRAMAERMVGPVRAGAPRRSGNLAASVRAGATQRSGVVRAGNRGRVPYAGPIHFGWPRHNIRPNPFMWEVLDSRRDDIEREYVERITQLVDRIGGDQT